MNTRYNTARIPIKIIYAMLIITCNALFLGTIKKQSLQISAGPYIMNVTKTSAVIMWETNLPSTGTVEFGEELNKKEQITSNEAKTIHEILIKDLNPETNYHYRVISVCKGDAGKDSSVSNYYTFRTAVKKDSPFSFVVIGDSRTYPERYKKISEKVYGERPNFVIHVGDVVSNGKIKDQWINEFIEPASSFMHFVPTYVAIGNHERNAHWFYDYVSYPPPENYYSFCYGNADFFIVDTNTDFSKDSEQYKWLQRSLKKSRAVWKFVAHHHPPFSSDSNDYGDSNTGKSALGDISVRSLVPLYEKYHVDVVWFGHIHTYERTWPIRNNKVDMKNGVIYIQAGGGGAELEEFAPERSWFTAKLLRNWQYCVVDISGNYFRMTAYDINGQLYDFLELRK